MRTHCGVRIPVAVQAHWGNGKGDGAKGFKCCCTFWIRAHLWAVLLLAIPRKQYRWAVCTSSKQNTYAYRQQTSVPDQDGRLYRTIVYLGMSCCICQLFANLIMIKYCAS